MADHTHDPYLGKLINDRFRVQQLVARGDTSRVYRAEQVPLGRTVALKILDHAYSDTHDSRFAQRFFMEASVASQLRHPNTVAVFDYGRTEDGTYFIAMEYVEGETLAAVLHRAQRLRPDWVAAIAIQIARSAREAHQLDVVHRDLRPANVLLSRHGDDDDVVKVLGFGLVKPSSKGGSELTQTGVFLGSPRHMSPEHIRGEALDPRSDVYALGIIMYELIMGETPFEHPTAVRVLMGHMHDAVPPMVAEGLPSQFSQLILDCLSKHPGDRPDSMDAVIARLKALGEAFDEAHPSLHSSSHIPLPETLELAEGATPRQSMRHAHSSMPHRPMSSVSSGRPRSGAWKRAAVVVGAMAAAAGLAVAGNWEQFLHGSAGAGSQAPRETDDDDAPVRPASEAPGSTFIRVSSDPPGAEVEIGGRSYGRTPLVVELDPAEARMGDEVSFTLRHAGYEPAHVTRTLRARRIEIHAALSPHAAVPAETP